MRPRRGPAAGLLAALALSVALSVALAGCAARPQEHAVLMAEGRRFAPATLTARVGERVVWRNRSEDRHAVVLEGPAAGGALGSPELFHNEEWAHSLDRPGAYRFACVFHGDEGMVGVLTVVQ